MNDLESALLELLRVARGGCRTCCGAKEAPYTTEAYPGLEIPGPCPDCIPLDPVTGEPSGPPTGKLLPSVLEACPCLTAEYSGGYQGVCSHCSVQCGPCPGNCEVCGGFQWRLQEHDLSDALAAEARRRGYPSSISGPGIGDNLFWHSYGSPLSPVKWRDGVGSTPQAARIRALLALVEVKKAP